VILTETWLTDNDKSVLAELVPNGGGIMMIFKGNIHIHVKDCSQSGKYTHFEYITCMVTSKNKSFCLSSIYRPPPSNANGLRTSVFLQEWEDYIEHLVSDPHELIITGDVNLHIDDSDTKQMNSILDAYGLTQHITEPTHRLGHTLDFLVTRTQNSLLGGVPTVTDPHLYNSIGQAACDHLGISFMLIKCYETSHYQDIL